MPHLVRIARAAVPAGAFVLTALSGAATYHLSPSGNDATGDGSLAKPWRSLAAVAANVAPRQGHVVRLAAGTYTQASAIWLPVGITLQGVNSPTSSARTTIRCLQGSAWPGTTINFSTGSFETAATTVRDVAFDGGNYTGFSALDFRKLSNVTVQGCRFTGLAGTSIQIKMEDDSGLQPPPGVWLDNPRVLGNTFVRNKGRAVLGQGWRNMEVADNVVSNPDVPGASLANPSPWGDGFQIYWCEGGRIHHNRITVPDYIPEETQWSQQNCAPTITILQGAGGIEIDNNRLNQWVTLVFNREKGSAPTVDFHHNTMIATADVASEGVEIMWDNATIRDNVFENFEIGVLTDDGTTVPTPLRNVRIFRNAFRRTWPVTAYETYGIAIRNTNAASLEDFLVYNNVFDGYQRAFQVDGGGPITSLYVRNNLVLNADRVFNWAWPQQTNVASFVATNNVWHFTGGLERNPRPTGVSLSSNYPSDSTSLPSAAASGVRLTGTFPTNWYFPTGAGAYVVDKGTTTINGSVSVTEFSGAAPDVGLYEFVSGPRSAPPTIVEAPSASPNPVSGDRTGLSVRGADDRGEPALTYTWSVQSKPDGASNPVFSTNGNNSAKRAVATFSGEGVYVLRVVVRDRDGGTATGTVTVTVGGSPLVLVH